MKEQARIRAFANEDYDQVFALWRESGLTIKISDTLPEITKLLALPSSVFLVAEAETGEPPSRIVGTVIGAWDGRRAWIYHLAVRPAARRGGIGSRLVRAVEEALRCQGATKINQELPRQPSQLECPAFF